MTEIDCNSDKDKPEQIQTHRAEKTRCYLVDSSLPRNIILRERLLTADAEVKPELAATLTADQEQVAASELNKISPLDLKWRNFDYADFSESSLPRVDLRRANLKYANLNHVRLDKAQLSMARLSGANLGEAELADAILDEAKLSSAYLISAKLARADLKWANLAGTHLQGAKLVGANLFNTVLAGADLSGADLSGAHLQGAKLAGANLSKVNLAGAHLQGAELADANLNKADLAGADLSGAGLDDADLREVVLAGADLRNAELAGADLSWASLAGAIISNRYFPMNDAKVLNELLEEYQKQLKQVPAYQTSDDKNFIAQKVKKLRERVAKTANFSNISMTYAPCLTDDPQLKGEISCLIWDEANQQSRNKVLNFWTIQACKGVSNGKMSPLIMLRAILKQYYLKKLDYAWPGLALKLQQAGKNTKACPGLAALSEYFKEDLNTAALEQANAQKPPHSTRKLKKRTKSHRTQTSKHRKTTAISAKR